MTEDLKPGQMLADRFEIVALTGRGGMASVYEARDTVLGRTVAIKLFTVDTSDDHARLESEVRLLSGLNHPNLVTVHDARVAVDPDGGLSFLVMEFVTGRTLREANRDSPLSKTAMATVAADIAEALSVVHEAGIVHRDVKPANILLESSPLSSSGIRGKLADFGIAHSIGADRLTAVGTVIGTAGYLSPEQAEGRDVTPASDIYSLGLVLLESLKGEKEYPGTPAESLSARLARDPVIPQSLDIAWVTLLTEMLGRDPAGRPTAVEASRRSAAIAAAESPYEALMEALPTASMPTEAMPTEAMPTEAMPTELMRTEVMPTALLPAAFDTPAPATTTRVLPAAPAGAAPTSGKAGFVRRHRWRIAVIVAVLVALAVVAIVLAQFPVRSAAPTVHTPSPSSTPTPVATTVVAPPQPTPAVPNGNGKGHDKGPGKGPGKGAGPGPKP